ncbi:unnamed protein product [Pleuronectes platessa]|uniref:Uncharacterized protein n=1 Tax=Pleuronectes platessa TaxID=8262 RepID=A0A9N7YN79_PLEPL|nr:unnamed protein product [Pleuronectes platessa]
MWSPQWVFEFDSKTNSVEATKESLCCPSKCIVAFKHCLLIKTRQKRITRRSACGESRHTTPIKAPIHMKAISRQQKLFTSSPPCQPLFAPQQCQGAHPALPACMSARLKSLRRGTLVSSFPRGPMKSLFDSSLDWLPSMSVQPGNETGSVEAQLSLSKQPHMVHAAPPLPGPGVVADNDPCFPGTKCSLCPQEPPDVPRRVNGAPRGDGHQGGGPADDKRRAGPGQRPSEEKEGESPSHVVFIKLESGPEPEGAVRGMRPSGKHNGFSGVSEALTAAPCRVASGVRGVPGGVCGQRGGGGGHGRSLFSPGQCVATPPTARHALLFLFIFRFFCLHRRPTLEQL